MDSSLIGDRTKFAYIDSVCDRFETAWKKGPPPLLENFLANASKQVSPELFRALLELEIDYRRKNNLPISKQDYLSRFPQFVNHIDHLFPSHDSQQTYSQQTEGDDLGSTDTPGNSPLSLPMSLGRYELQNEIARGGMGGVFLAKDLKFSRTLAVKVLLPPRDHTAKVKERFLEETQLMGQLQHPGIPPVHDQGELPDGRPYFCMKLIKGQTLSKLLKERANATAEKPRFLDIFQQICQTVAYTHSRNIIHRDLKPSNIMVGAFGEVQVMDWGLAKKKRPPPEAGTSTKSETLPQSTIYSLRSKPDSGESTQAGQVLGTPAYMPPEQARGEVELLDERSDVFGLGAILCEILTSLPPFAGTSALENHRQSMKGDLSDAFSRLDGCGADNTLIELCRVCLAPNPEDRPADAAEVAEAVAAYQEGVQEKLRQAELQRAQAEVKVSEERKRRRLWFWLTTAAAGLFLSVVVGLAVSTWKWQEAEENFAIAKENEKEAKKQEKEAKKQTKLAIKNELFARNRSYVLSMKEAYGNYNASRMGRVHDLLDAQIPEPGQEDLRGFEWYLLKRLSHQEKRVLTTPDMKNLFSVLAWSPDGSMLASGSSGVLRLWDFSTGKEISRHKVGNVTGHLAFSPDGKKIAIATAGYNRWEATKAKETAPRIFDLQTQKMSSFLHPKKNRKITRYVAWSPDGKFLAAANYDGKIQLYEDQLDKKPITLEAKEYGGWPYHLAFSPDNKSLFVSDEKRVVVWDLATKKIKHKLENNAKAGSKFALSPDGKLLAALIPTGELKIGLYETTTFEELGQLEFNLPGIQDMAFSPNGQLFAVALSRHENLPNHINLYHVPSRKLVATFRGHRQTITSLAFSPDGKYLASSGDGPIRIWDVSGFKDLGREEGRVFITFGLSFSPDGQKLAIGRYKRLSICDLSTGQEEQWPAGFYDRVIVAWSKRGNFLVTSEWEHSSKVKVWDAETKKLRHQLPGHKGGNKAIAISPDGNLIATGMEKYGPARVWDSRTGELIHSFPNQWSPKAVSFSPDGTLLAVGTGTIWYNINGELRLWNVRTGKEIINFEEVNGTVNAVVFSPDGQSLATASSESIIQIWDVKTGKLIRNLAGHSEGVMSLCYSPDGTRLVSGDREGYVKIWDPKNGDELASLKMPRILASLAFSSNGRTLAVGYESKFHGQNLKLLSLDRLATPKLDPSVGWCLKGWEQYGKKYIEKATQAFKESVKITPNNCQGWYGLGKSLIASGHTQEGLEALKKAVQVDPTYVRGWFSLGLTFHNLEKKWEEAESAYLKVLESEPHHVTALNNLGVVVKAFRGNYHQSLFLHQQATRLNPKDSFGHKCAGFRYFYLKSYSQATRRFRRATELNPRDDRAWINLGNSAMHEENFFTAEEAFRKYAKLKPDVAAGYFQLGLSLQKQGQFTKAKTIFREAFEKFPVPVADRHQEECHNLDLLKRKLPSVLEGKETPSAHELFSYAEICWKYLGRYSDAIHLYNKALKTNPELICALNSGHRIGAIKSTLRAAVGMGKDANLSLESRAKIASQVSKWLPPDCLTPGHLMNCNLEEIVRWLGLIDSWRRDPRYHRIRKNLELAKVPKETRKLFEKMWQDIDKARQKINRTMPHRVYKNGKLEDRNEERVHTLKMTAGKTYLLDLTSREFDPVLRIRDDSNLHLIKNDDGGEGYNSHLRLYPVKSGEYQIIISSYKQRGAGNYQLRVREFDDQQPRSEDGLLIVATNYLDAGRLDEAKKVLKVVEKIEPASATTFFTGNLMGDKSHTVQLISGKLYSLQMRSGLFDNLLFVEDNRGKVLAQDDDSGPGLNATILFTPETTGKYRLIASSYKNQAKGPYLIQIKELLTTKKFSGTLTDKKREVALPITLTKGTSYFITMQSQEFDTYLRLEDRKGRVYSRDDDSGPSLNAQIYFTSSETAQFRIIATSFLQRGQGKFQINIGIMCKGTN